MYWFAAAAALCLWSLAFFYLRALVRRRTSPDHILFLLQEEVRQLEADIDAKTEQNLQLLEEKIRVLREMCAEAERRIAVLSRELELRERGVLPGLSSAVLPVPSPSVEPKKPGPEKPRRTGKAARPAYPPLLRGLEVRDFPPQTPQADKPTASGLSAAKPPPAGPEAYSPSGALPSGMAAGTFPSGTLPGSVDQAGLKIVSAPIPIKGPPLKDRIAELYRAGFTLELIAERLNVPIGEARFHVAMIEGNAVLSRD